jgi:hypothetical protein
MATAQNAAHLATLRSREFLLNRMYKRLSVRKGQTSVSTRRRQITEIETV